MENNKELRPIRTYKDDVNKILHNQPGVETQKSIAREREREMEKIDKLKYQKEELIQKTNFETPEEIEEFPVEDILNEGVKIETNELENISQKVNEEKQQEINKEMQKERNDKELEKQLKATEDKLEAVKKYEEETRTRNFNENTGRVKKTLSLVAILILIIISFYMAIIIFLALTKNTEVPQVEKVEESFIFTEEQEYIDITNLSGQQLYSTIRETFTQKESIGTILNLIPFQNVGENNVQTSARTFLESLEIQLAPSMLNSLQDYFLLGSDGQDVFVILFTNNYQSAFTGTLQWGKHYIPRYIFIN